jgi:hypothetical protein
LEDVRPINLEGELALLGQVEVEQFDIEAWQEVAALFIERVTARKETRSEITWKPAANLMCEAVNRQPAAERITQ